MYNYPVMLIRTYGRPRHLVRRRWGDGRGDELVNELGNFSSSVAMTRQVTEAH